MSDPPVELADLEQDRSRLYSDLSKVGDFRRGALHAVRRKCGKANCACADPPIPATGRSTTSLDRSTPRRSTFI